MKIPCARLVKPQEINSARSGTVATFPDRQGDQPVAYRKERGFAGFELEYDPLY